jgi:hypothetical protein
MISILQIKENGFSPAVTVLLKRKFSPQSIGLKMVPSLTNPLARKCNGYTEPLFPI